MNEEIQLKTDTRTKFYFNVRITHKTMHDSRKKKFKSTHSHTIDDEKKSGVELEMKAKKSFSHHRIRKKCSH